MSTIARRSVRAAKAASIFSAILFLTTSIHAQALVPVINSATVDTTASTLTLAGSNLLGPDGHGIFSISLLYTPSGVPIPLTVVSSSTTSITAAFPAGSPAATLTPGNYTVQVRFYTTTASAVNSVLFQFTVSAPVSTPPPSGGGGGSTTPPTTGSTTLVFQFVNNSLSSITTIAITNLSTASASANGGSCSITFSGPGAPATFSATGILPGTVYTNNLALEAPSFMGYVTAVCNFKAVGAEFAPYFALPALVNP